MTAHTEPRFDLDAAPLSVSHVRLTVRDLDLTKTFYAKLLGLRVHSETETSASLGADSAFLTLQADPSADPSNPAAPGLFHTALLLPDRSDLATWLAYASDHGLRPWGASDHNVSEAIYLNDPEGNGIEVYADRPVGRWINARGDLYMPSHRLDISALPAPKTWTSAPDGTRIGHVHLQTTDIAEAEAFWTGLGMEVTARYPGGSFFGSGGYHHQIAANTWRSRNTRPLARPVLGLSEVTLTADASVTTVPVTHTAPSGVSVKLSPKRT
ncbi:MAG: VOC family protein [Pseudomonadota bacterium]